MTDVIHKVLNDITADEQVTIIGGDFYTRNVKRGCFWCRFRYYNGASDREASMPIPESVKVDFKGDMKNYMDFRDVVHATSLKMLETIWRRKCIP
jgi:aconitate hydratase 2/2-methylisocitrate dehydratase